MIDHVIVYYHDDDDDDDEDEDECHVFVIVITYSIYFYILFKKTFNSSLPPRSSARCAGLSLRPVQRSGGRSAETCPSGAL